MNRHDAASSQSTVSTTQPPQAHDPGHQSNREWLTAAEAAAYAGDIGIDTVRVACNLNRLRHVRIGGSARGPIRTRREWIDEWLEQWTRGGRAA